MSYNRQERYEDEQRGNEAASVIWFVVFVVLVICTLIAN